MAKKSKHPQSSKKGGKNSGEDVFIDWVLSSWDWAKNNTQTVTVAAVVLGLGVAAGLYYQSYRSDLNQQAVQEFEQVHQVAGAGQPESAQNELRRFLERFGDTPYAAEARILLAESHLRGGEPDEAISTLQDLAADLSEPVNLQAAFLLGVAYEEAGRWDDAQSLYLELSEEAEMTFQVREALADAARIRAQQGDYPGAAELYRQVLETYDDQDSQDQAQAQSDAQRRSLYRLRLAEMEAAADEGS